MTRAHPSRAAILDWDESNEHELALHGISPTEVVEAWLSGPTFAPNKRRRSGDWKMLGLTQGGRRVTIVVHYDPDRGAIRPITGWASTPGELTRYFQRG